MKRLISITMDEINLGLQLRKIRKDKRLSQTEIADKIGLSQSAYAKIENGRTSLDFSRLIKLIDILEISIDLFIREHLGLSSKNITDRERYIKHLEKEVLFLRRQLAEK